MKSQEDTHCRNWRAVFLLLFCTVPRVLHAQMPPGGGWSWPTNLNSWSFGDTNTWQSDNGHAPISSTNIVGSEQGDISVGYSMVMDSTNPARLQFNLIESDGSTNLTLAAGTVFLWFNPDWASSSTNQSGTGPGVWGRLIDVGSYTTNANFGWWSLYLDSGGTNIYFSAQTNSGDGATATYLSAPIDWASNDWHEIALTYSQTNSELYLDGSLAASGSGVTIFPGGDALTNGFYIATDNSGTNQVHGLVDDLYTYNYPLDAKTIENLYGYFLTWYMINPFDIHSFIVSAPPSPSSAPTFQVFSGAGNLIIVTNGSGYISNINVWITNVVAVASNGTVALTFEITGGADGAMYSVFATSQIGPSPSITNWVWKYQGQSPHCATCTLPGLTDSAVYLMLGQPWDSDQDGLTDAFELLVSHSNPAQYSTRGDGIGDGIAYLLGHNLFVPGMVPDTNKVVNLQVYTPME